MEQLHTRPTMPAVLMRNGSERSRASVLLDVIQRYRLGTCRQREVPLYGLQIPSIRRSKCLQFKFNERPWRRADRYRVRPQQAQAHNRTKARVFLSERSSHAPPSMKRQHKMSLSDEFCGTLDSRHGSLVRYPPKPQYALGARPERSAVRNLA